MAQRNPSAESRAETMGEGDFRTLPEKLAATLREKILLGEFAPGTQIHERETSDALGVSRTPLREALRILGNEGLVEVRAARSPIVSNPTAKELGQLYTVMRVLEALAAELACAQATDSDLERIRTAHLALREVDPAQDTLAFFKGDQLFHQQIVRAAASPPLAKTHAEYNARLWRARYLTAEVYSDRDRILHDHEQILTAIQSRDTQWAVTSMSAHLRSAKDRIERLLPAGGPQ